LIDNETSKARQTLRCVPAAAEPWQKHGVDGPLLSAAEEKPVNAIIYLVGLVVIVMAILSFVGMR
jgi:hypothetical protein